MNNFKFLYDQNEKTFIIPVENYFQILLLSHGLHHYSRKKTKDIVKNLFNRIQVKVINFFCTNCCCCSEHNRRISEIRSLAQKSKFFDIQEFFLIFLILNSNIF